MPRRRLHAPLKVCLDNQLVGKLLKEASGAISFQYDEAWLNSEQATPISLALPLREDPYRGRPVMAVFENLLPDSVALCRKIAERVGAEGADAYSLLAAIGHDCVGALQFMAEGIDFGPRKATLSGEAIDEASIEKLLLGLAQAPLGLSRDDDFRISIAGAQEKTALLRHGNKWLKPHGATPTTHLLKKQIGTLPNGIDLSNSVENEYYCLKLFEAFGLQVNRAEIQTFGKTKALIVERFDRRWTSEGRLVRLPQEDCCQALAIPPGLKYQSEGGPGIVEILELLGGSDRPAEDQKKFLKAHIVFWLIGATDGHGKNFSIYLRPGGSYSLTPFYDVMTAQPSLDANQIQRKQMKLAMSVGPRRHYRVDEIVARHFVQTAEAARLPRTIIHDAITEIADTIDLALDRTEAGLPRDFPGEIHDAVKSALKKRSRGHDLRSVIA